MAHILKNRSRRAYFVAALFEFKAHHFPKTSVVFVSSSSAAKVASTYSSDGNAVPFFAISSSAAAILCSVASLAIAPRSIVPIVMIPRFLHSKDVADRPRRCL